MPLDYDDTAAGETTVAFIQHASNVTGAQDILINPGGPGGSGTAILRAYKQRFRSLLGQGYNLVGFDPRGVGSSGLRLDCVPDNPALTAYYDAKLLEPIDPGSKDSLTETFALAGGFGQLCSHTHSDGKAGYANSVAVAADMLHFATLRAPDGTPEADVLVNYYGASYGTALGTAFAALHPEHVGKFILDAVVDGEDYFKGGWKENLLQADDCVRSFSRFCFEAKEYVDPCYIKRTPKLDVVVEATHLLINNPRVHVTATDANGLTRQLENAPSTPTTHPSATSRPASTPSSPTSRRTPSPSTTQPRWTTRP